jgi:hypothetical protein
VRCPVTLAVLRAWDVADDCAALNSGQRNRRLLTHQSVSGALNLLLKGQPPRARNLSWRGNGMHGHERSVE